MDAELITMTYLREERKKMDFFFFIEMPLKKDE